MEQVGRLVPMNPHSTEVVTEEVVKGVSGQEAEAVRDPVYLICVVVEVGFCLLTQLSDGLSALLVCPRPDFQGNAVECVRGVLLEDERMVDTVRLVLAGAYLDIMRETGLYTPVSKCTL